MHFFPKAPHHRHLWSSSSIALRCALVDLGSFAPEEPETKTNKSSQHTTIVENYCWFMICYYTFFFQCLCFFVDDVDVLSFCIWRFEKTCSCFWCENYWRCCRGFSPPTRSTGWPCGRLHLGHPKWCLSFFFLIVPLEFKQKIQLESPKWSGKVCIN